MKVEEILNDLKTMANTKVVASMAKFGINSYNALGISIPQLRKIAKKIGKDHLLAQALWDSGIHEARILASFIDDPQLVTEQQMEEWVKQFDSWDVCDQVCGNLFDKTNYAYSKAHEWSKNEREFIKRAGFVLMADLAIHDKDANDDDFIRFLEVIKENSTDERNFVKKAVNWALRQIGKRNIVLNKKAIDTAKEIQKIESKSAKWIAQNAIKELTSNTIEERFKKDLFHT